jgi:DHA1 family bicyclomycin/chloramphenicol resistance-like MFS transporter
MSSTAVKPESAQRQIPAGFSFIGLSFVLAALSWIGPFSIDTYLPSLPSIGRTFHISEMQAQQTMTAFLLPFAIMSLWHGAISDSFGRRRLTLISLGLFTVSSIGCALAGSIHSLIIFRALQGATAGAGSIIGRAIVRDVLDGPDAQRLMSHIATVFAVAPITGPVLGGWLEVWFGWRSRFVFLIILSAVLLFWCMRALPETLPRERRLPFEPAFLGRSYWRVLTEPAFLLASVSMALLYSAFFIYILAAPVFLIKHLKVRETQFLWLFGPMTAGMLIGAWISGFCAGKITRLQTMYWGYAVMIGSALGNIMINVFLPPSLPLSIVPLFFFVLGISMAMPGLNLAVLDLFPEQRGMVSSCQNFISLGGNTLISAGIALMWATPLTMAVSQIIMLAGGLFVIYFYIRKYKSTVDRF